MTGQKPGMAVAAAIRDRAAADKKFCMDVMIIRSFHVVFLLFYRKIKVNVFLFP